MQRADRLVSLDVFRGITIAGMLLVNNPGSWGAAYPPLRHAGWNGWTPTDLVFPFFLFIVGVAMMFSFPKRLALGASRRGLFAHVVRRSAALLLLGYAGGTFSPIVFPSAVDTGGVILRIGCVLAATAALLSLVVGLSRLRLVAFAVGLLLAVGGGALAAADDALLRRLANLRFPGVLVRIGVCYLLASAIYFLTPRPRAIVVWIAALLGAYWLWMVYVPIPGFGPADLTRGFPDAATPVTELFSNWCFYVDHHVLGDHVWGARKLRDAGGNLIWSFDPEGILSTIPAVATVLFGALAGLWIRRDDRTPAQRLAGLYGAGALLLAFGLLIGLDFPINKRLWTSSYVVFTAGMASVFLATCYYAVDVRGWRRWCAPFVWYGMNAITAFVASGMFSQALGRTGGKRALMRDVLDPAFAEPMNASLAYALAFVVLWCALMGLLYRRRIFLKL